MEEPLYTLRYAGGGNMPPEVAAGTLVFSVERFSTYVLPEAVMACTASLLWKLTCLFSCCFFRIVSLPLEPSTEGLASCTSHLHPS